MDAGIYTGKPWLSDVQDKQVKKSVLDGIWFGLFGSLFILAGLLKCPIYLMFCLKQQAQYHVYFELFCERLEFRNRKERLQTLDNVVQEYASRLGHFCLKAPMQWFNFFPFWSEK